MHSFPRHPLSEFRAECMLGWCSEATQLSYKFLSAQRMYTVALSSWCLLCDKQHSLQIPPSEDAVKKFNGACWRITRQEKQLKFKLRLVNFWAHQDRWHSNDGTIENVREMSCFPVEWSVHCWEVCGKKETLQMLGQLTWFFMLSQVCLMASRLSDNKAELSLLK